MMPLFTGKRKAFCPGYSISRIICLLMLGGRIVSAEAGAGSGRAKHRETKAA